MSSNIVINGNPVGSPEPSRDAANTNYIYIQGHKPLTGEQKRQLADASVEIYEYTGNNTYLCRYEPADIRRIQDLDFISRANVYHRRLKTTPGLDESMESAEAGKTFTVDIVLHKSPNSTEDVAQELAQVAGVDPENISVEHKKIRVTTDAETIAKIKDVDTVKGIEEVAPITLFNNVARKDLDGDPITIEETTFEGTGQIVAVADTGFDIGSKTDVHPAFTDRVVELYALGRPTTKMTNDFHGHGTHCAGSVLGDGVSATMGGKIRGTAPKAKLVLQSLLTNNGGLATPPNLWNLFEPPYTNNKARVASNSWGPDWRLVGSKQLPYDDQADAVDSFVYKNPDHVIVFAGGNDGAEPSATGAHIGSSSAAKNCITVGATQSSRANKNYKFDATSSTAGDPTKVAGFSSLGPTIEKRIKPDVVAPGIAILSASSRDPKITATQRNTYGPTKDNLWAFSSGTSMATPLVAGCAAVIREVLISAGTKRPSAALVKALLINGAVDLGLPTSAQGFGRVDLRNSLLPVENPSEIQGYVDQGAWTNDEKLKEDQTWTKKLTLPLGFGANKALKVTLAYSDRKGSYIQNNLTLQVKIGDVVRRGDEGQADDYENNVEQIVWENPPSGEVITITVDAERIARPGDTQSFALVWRVA